MGYEFNLRQKSYTAKQVKEKMRQAYNLGYDKELMKIEIE